MMIVKVSGVTKFSADKVNNQVVKNVEYISGVSQVVKLDQEQQVVLDLVEMEEGSVFMIVPVRCNEFLAPKHLFEKRGFFLLLVRGKNHSATSHRIQKRIKRIANQLEFRTHH